MSANEYWQKFVERNEQELENLSPSELDELAMIVLSAIDEEINNPNYYFFRMTWGLATIEPSKKVMEVLKEAGFRLVSGTSYSHFEWYRFLTTEK